MNWIFIWSFWFKCSLKVLFGKIFYLEIFTLYPTPWYKFTVKGSYVLNVLVRFSLLVLLLNQSSRVYNFYKLFQMFGGWFSWCSTWTFAQWYLLIKMKVRKSMWRFYKCLSELLKIAVKFSSNYIVLSII